MAGRSSSNSEKKDDCKNKKIKISYKVPADNVFSSDHNKCPAVEQKSSTCEKRFELTSKQPIKIKCETGELNEMSNALPNTSASSVKISSLRSPAMITIKKENARETSLKLSTYKTTPMRSAILLNLQSGEVNSDKSGNQAVSNYSKKQGVIRLALKDISDEERKILRAKRFNIIVADSSENNKVITKTVPNRSYDRITVISNQSTPTYDTLKKRAERFGENVSSVMKSLDYKEKLLKRKLKFLESVTSLKELEVKKQRAERFRMV